MSTCSITRNILGATVGRQGCRMIRPPSCSRRTMPDTRRCNNMALRIQTNQPQQVRLLAVEPETAPSNFGADQHRWKTSAGDLYVSLAVSKIFTDAVAAQAIHIGEWVEISKYEAQLGNGRKGIRWELRRLSAPAAAAAPPPVGPQTDGTFAIDTPPAPPERKPVASEFA